MNLTFRAVSEPNPGEKWRMLFHAHWPGYRKWFLSEGDEARPSYLASVRALRQHMPEIVPTYEKLCELAGGGDLAARFLSFYCPPAYLSGCSQAIWQGATPLLVRNYDYSPRLCDGLILHTRWTGNGVVAQSDCLWGALDGINEHGLAVSLTFGGRRVVGVGFGVPLLLRYVLEICSTAAEAAEVLRRVPTHMAYNVTVLDAADDFFTAHLSPDREPVIEKTAVATNHQGRIEWSQHARATATVERERFLLHRLTLRNESSDRFVGAFFRPPLYSLAYDRGFGTLYTAVYVPRTGSAEYRWPGTVWRLSVDAFTERSHVVRFSTANPDTEKRAGPIPQ